MIMEGGMEEYYKKRENDTFEPLFYELDESLLSDYINSERRQSIKLQIHGIHCQSCTWLLGKVLEKTEGVTRFSFSSLTASLQIEWDNEKITLPDLVNIFYRMGYPAYPYTLSGYHGALKKECYSLLIRFGTAAFLSMNLMMITFALYIGYFQELGSLNTKIFSWAGALLAAPVLFGCGAPIFAQAWRNLKKYVISMDVLIVFGAISAYVVSLYGSLTQGEVYYDTAVMIITLVLLGRLIEANAKKQCADTIMRYLNKQAKKAIRLNGDKKESIHPKQIIKGDLIEVPAGETVPADGTIMRGKAEISQAVITGEHIAILKEVGDEIIGGSVVENGNVVFRAEEVGEGSFLGKLVKITEYAQNSRTKIQGIADTITSRFVPLVGVLALLTFLFRLNQGFIPSLFGAISVILIACPCALGLATPLAISLAMGEAAGKGIIIKESEILERVNSIKSVFLDKTGTLTKGKPHVADVELSSNVLPYLVNLEKHSPHPIAKAICSLGDFENMEFSDFDNVPGHGVTAIVGGKCIAAGTPDFLLNSGFEDSDKIFSSHKKSDRTIIFVGFEKKVRGLVAVEDLLRPRAENFVAWLKNREIRVKMLTGDGEGAALYIAKKTGIEDVFPRCLPKGKLELIRENQKNGMPVMMIGDGANDAPALALSDIGIAMGAGVGMAIDNAHVTLLQNSLDDVSWLFALSEKTMLIIKQNFFWAFAYNLVGIPLAMAGVLTPIHSAVMMVVSSLCVVGNSLRIKRGVVSLKK